MSVIVILSEFWISLSRAAAVGASAGHGIIGTCDGLVYTWEMSTGTKLGTMHHFKGKHRLSPLGFTLV